MPTNNKKIAELEKSENKFKMLAIASWAAFLVAACFCVYIYFDSQSKIDAYRTIVDWQSYTIWDSIAEQACTGNAYAATCKAEILGNQRGFHFADDYLEAELDHGEYSKGLQKIRSTYGDNRQ